MSCISRRFGWRSTFCGTLIMQYKLQKNPFTNEIGSIQVVGNPLISIPCDPDNKDYQEYLKWVAEGNTPEEAE